MSNHASMQKNKEVTKKRRARVIPIRKGSERKGKSPKIHTISKTLPLLFIEPIFKAKKHDPL